MDYGYNNNGGGGGGYTTTYGGQGAADGGGWVGEQAQSSQGGGKSYGKDTVRPVTIKQIMLAEHPHPDADFKIDGDVVTQVTFVGQVRNISKQATNVTYKVDDGTDLIEVKQWIDSEADEMDMDTGKAKLHEDGYCRVWGRPRAFHDKRHVQAHIIRPIDDYNEINYHLLEATAMHLFFKYGAPTEASDQKQAQTNGKHEDGAADSGLPSNLSPRAQAIYKYLKSSPQSNEGQHVDLIAMHTGMDPDVVASAADELVAAGLTFTTVDDKTWAVLDF